MPPSYADRLLTWFDDHGRKHLPWQQPRTPYRVWVSEIMLQQTQVTVVVDYFTRFMTRFPSVESLASAHVDDVLSLWAGLGYYARGRNLHKAAQVLCEQHAGKLPADLAGLEALPGIGRSTAGAIVSMGFDQPAPILDGNVKRVLARHAGIDGWPGRSAVARQLWALAENRLPSGRFADYSQASMDLGATVCTRHAPACHACPLNADCVAHRSHRTHELPAPKPKANRKRRRSQLWLIRNEQGHYLLERRPPVGIWGGLWSLPEADDATTPPLALVEPPRPEPVLVHELTHFTWELCPMSARTRGAQAIADGDNMSWYAPDNLPGVPAPIRRLIEEDRAP